MINVKKNILILAVVLAFIFAFAACENTLVPPSGQGANDWRDTHRIVKQTVLPMPSLLTSTAWWLYSYNPDGSLKQLDAYNSEGTHINTTSYFYEGGLLVKAEVTLTEEQLITEKWDFSYENGVLKTRLIHSLELVWDDELGESVQVYTPWRRQEFTFQNGRKVRDEMFLIPATTFIAVFSYDEWGRRIQTTQQNYNPYTGALTSVSISNRSYNTNGTFSSIIFSTGGSRFFEWEEQTTSYDYDVLFTF